MELDRLILTGGSGMTSEQSIILLVSWPVTASFSIAALNADWSLAWSVTNDCHSHAVRESRASYSATVGVQRSAWDEAGIEEQNPAVN